MKKFAFVMASLVLTGSAQAEFFRFVADPRVQKETSITRDQVETIKAIQAKMQLDIAPLAVAEIKRSKEYDKLREAFEAGKIATDPGTCEPIRFYQYGEAIARARKVLTPAQRKRIDQLEFREFGFLALTSPQYIRQFNRNDETVAMIRQVIDEQRAGLTTVNARLNGTKDPREHAKLPRRHQDDPRREDAAAEAAVLRLLTKKQRAKYRELKDDPLPPPAVAASPTAR